MSKSDNDTNASQSNAADAWLSQLSDPKTWQSMMTGMQGIQPGMPGLGANHAVHAMVPPEKLTDNRQK